MVKKSTRKMEEDKIKAQENEKETATEVKEEPEQEKHEVSSKTKKDKKSQAYDIEIKALEEKVKEFQDKYLRLSAEFDNYRKRTLKERIDLLKSAGEEMIVKVLPVLDDFERAQLFMENAKDVDAVKSGVDLIYSKLKEILSQQGLKEISALGEEFDTDKHEAITKIPAPDEKLKGKIVDVIEKGYYLNDKVIRYSKVIIGE
jgi:molecular chaperone GrpE